jgi:hypothetical protein
MAADPLVRIRDAFDGQVRGFRRAGGEDNLVGRRSVNERRDLLPGFGKGVASTKPLLMERGWAPEDLGEVRLHCFEGLG